MNKFMTTVAACALTIGGLAVYRAQAHIQGRTDSSKMQSGNVIINIESNSVPGELHRAITITLKDKFSKDSVKIVVDSMYFMGEEKAGIENALAEMFINNTQARAIKQNVRPLMKEALQKNGTEREALLTQATAQLKNLLVG